MNNLLRKHVVAVIVAPRICGVLALGVVLAGCAPPLHSPRLEPTGSASWRAVVPAGTERYTLVAGDASSGATPIHRVTPVYPPSLLAACPAPLQVQALLIVNEAGNVGEVRVAHEASAAPDRRQFIDAVRVAARQWQFLPLRITHWATDASGNTHLVDTQSKPFSLTYAFRFECHAGKVSVHAEPTGS
ncbi:MAG: hypothetical protein ABI114_04235 [Rhodanobacter sp.]